MEILTLLLILLIVTRGLGEIAEQFGQPALMGEILGGILLGAMAHPLAGTFPALEGLADNEIFKALSDLGVFFLMLLAGIELNPKRMAEASKDAVWVAVLGMLIPLGFGYLLGVLFLPESTMKTAQCMFLGTALAITAVPVAIKILSDLGKLKTRIGRIIVSAAVYDDILSLLILAVLTALLRTGELPTTVGLFKLAGNVVIFFIVASAVGHFIFPRIGSLLHRFRLDELEFSLVLIVGLAYGALAHYLHMHFILGAFMAGLFFVRRTIDEKTYEDVKRKLSGITTGFLGPIFFASIGIHLNLSALWNIPFFLTLIIVVAFASKVLGAAIPLHFKGYARHEMLTVGYGMSARGAVELIIADIALQAGLFSYPKPVPPIISNLFSAVVIMAIVTTLLTPPLLKRSISKQQMS